MKTRRLVQKIKEFLSADRRAQIKRAGVLKDVLKKLEKKEARLKEKLDREKDAARRREILRKLEVLRAQRKKGVKLQKELADLPSGRSSR